MRLFIIGEYYPPLDGWYRNDEAPQGVPAVYNLFNYLGEHETHRFKAVIYTQDLDRIKVMPNGSEIHLIKRPFPIYLLWKLWVYCTWRWRGEKHLRGYDADVVYVQGSYVSAGASMARRAGLPSVSRIYGTILTDLVKRSKYLKLYTRNILEVLGTKQPCDLTICTKDGTQYDQVARFFNPAAEVTLLYNGMEAGLRQRLLAYPPVAVLSSDRPLRLASIARLYPYKRHHIAITVCAGLRQKGIDAQLTIVGSGPEEGNLRRLADELGVAAAVAFVPQMGQSEMLDWLASQDICCMHYAGGSLGNVLWECAMAGRIIATVDNGDTASVIQHMHNGIIAADDEHLAEHTVEAIVELYASGRAGELSRQVRADIAEIIPAWEERFDREMELIKDLIGTK